MKELVAGVLIASNSSGLDRIFDYLTGSFGERVQVGARVLVPFNNRMEFGFVWELRERNAGDGPPLKTISELLDPEPLIGAVQYQLVNWLSAHFFCRRMEVIRLCIPPGANPGREVHYELTVNPDELPERFGLNFPADQTDRAVGIIRTGLKKQWSKSRWQSGFRDLLPVWEFCLKERILIPISGMKPPQVRAKTLRVYTWMDRNVEKETAAGLRVFETLKDLPEGMTGAALAAAAKVSAGVIKRLEEQGKITCREVAVTRNPDGMEDPVLVRGKAVLTPEQQQAFDQILEARAGIFLLHGVTGSGKTETYLETAAARMEQGEQVLYLVPEIALTPQTLNRARKRFGDGVALVHSSLSDGERFDQWFRIKNGEACLVIGARSALFAPFRSLGMIIVDEEHEHAYKQEESPRYHTRRVVEKLAEITGATVIFGSATPAVETFYAAEAKKYHYIKLGRRFNESPLPEVTLVDMREELRQGNKNVLSRLLTDSVKNALSRGEQVILLLNRRGYATFILCRDCGSSLRCPHCEISLTYHLNDRVVRCHYCDHRQPVPDVCPQCKSSRIRYFGHGTQKLEEEIGQSFPGARLVRMDADSTARKGAHQEIYRQLVSGEFDILLGTQMIAKGLDLPQVTLVGAVSADSTLNLPDFRAGERTFQLLTQVAGRAGRGARTGRVVFQTYNPEHYALRYAQKHDYDGFYAMEIECRRGLKFPPFVELVKFSFSGIDPHAVETAAMEFGRTFWKLEKNLSGSGYSEILGPAPALIPRIENKYRWQMLYKSDDSDRLERLVLETWTGFPWQRFPTVRISRDRNPYSVV